MANLYNDYGVAGLLGQQTATVQDANGWYDFERRQREELYRQTRIAQAAQAAQAAQGDPLVPFKQPADNELLLLLDD